MSSKSRLALGLMSGTSADGLSAALTEIGPGRSLKVVAHRDFTYDAGLRKRILKVGQAEADELARLNFELGRLYAASAARFLAAERIAAKRLSVIGSHGQTVIHLPDEPRPSTLQIGEASFIAERLGVPVVCDFRPRDMAAGGQGAPLIPFMDEYLFGDGPTRVLQNVGGIGNAALVGRGVPLLAFDTGPGNCLIDAAARRVSRGQLSYDRDGRMAGSGKSDTRKIDALLRLPYFSRRPPKSLDRGSFDEDFLERHFGSMLRSRPLDALATITDFTAAAIVDSYRRFIFPKASVREVVVSGGGALNPVLMERFRQKLGTLPVKPISEYGIPALAKEPAAFALMALLAIEGRINHVPRSTGARRPRILGKIIPGHVTPA